MALYGFLTEFAGERYDSLDQQLKVFGAGIEVSLLSAIPAGSGLGTSSILVVLPSLAAEQCTGQRTQSPGSDQIIDLVKDYTLGCKLPGAGGGGYLYMVAKDPEAALRIRKILEENRPNDKARFVEMQLSHKGLKVSFS